MTGKPLNKELGVGDRALTWLPKERVHAGLSAPRSKYQNRCSRIVVTNHEQQQAFVEEFKHHLLEDHNNRFWVYLTALNEAQAHRVDGANRHLEGAESHMQSLLDAIDPSHRDEKGELDIEPQASAYARRAAYALLGAVHDVMVLIDNLLIFTEACSTYHADPMRWLCKNRHGLGPIRNRYKNLSAEDVRILVGLDATNNQPIFGSASSRHRELLEDYMDKGVAAFVEQMRILLEFYDKWKGVYLKYKHAPLEHPGQVALREVDNRIEVTATCYMVIRGEDSQGSPTYNSLVLPINANSIGRVRSNLERVARLHRTLLASRVLYHINLGRGIHVPLFAFDLPLVGERSEMQAALEALPYRGGQPEDFLQARFSLTFEGDAAKKLGQAYAAGEPATLSYDLFGRAEPDIDIRPKKVIPDA